MAQIALAGWTLGVLGLGIADGGVGLILIYVVAATTLVSGTSYLVRWNRHFASLEERT